MGLFDTFVVQSPRCELCGHIYDANFQTKVFDPSLRTFKQGDSLRELFNEVGFRFQGANAEFEMHDTCPKCDKYFETFGEIRNYEFIGQLPNSRKSKST